MRLDRVWKCDILGNWASCDETGVAFNDDKLGLLAHDIVTASDIAMQIMVVWCPNLHPAIMLESYCHWLKRRMLEANCQPHDLM